MDTLNKNIYLLSDKPINHTKASEQYVDVCFKYENSTWKGWVPIEYRRTGVHIRDRKHLVQYLNLVYNQMNPLYREKWEKNQDEFWSNKNAKTTKQFFDVLSKGGWKCVNHELPQNRNFARRIQDLKEFGYTIATDTKRYCPSCKKNTTHLIMLPIPRVELAGNGYETWSLALRRRILKVLENYDVYECTTSRNLLPDHKFSEIRWDDKTKAENPDDMTDAQIREKFQLLTNQRNQQKREVCRNCYQTGKRGTIYGIDYYYEGGPLWESSIPKKGKAAEAGCVGCPWYDIERWRKELKRKLVNKS